MSVSSRAQRTAEVDINLDRRTRKNRVVEAGMLVRRQFSVFGEAVTHALDDGSRTKFFVHRGSVAAGSMSPAAEPDLPDRFTPRN